MSINNPVKLFISDLRLWVHLGHSSEEKYHAQLVSVNVELIFADPPKALTTDSLEDTVCYFQIIQVIQRACQDKQFNLVEYLTAEIYTAVYQALSSQSQSVAIAGVNITVHKIHPPIPGLHGGILFTYSGSGDI